MADQIKKLGKILIETGYINQDQLSKALKEQSVTREKLGDILIRNGILSKEELEQALASQIGISKFDLRSYLIPSQVLALIPEDLARKYLLVPVFKVGNTITVAMSEPTNVFVIDELQRVTGAMIEAVWADEMDIRKTHEQCYGASGTLEEIVEMLEKYKNKNLEELKEEAPVIKLVNIIIVRAIEENASDIHIEPEEKFLGIRYRIDGILHRRESLPRQIESAIIARIKIMAGLDVAEKRLPQDGRILMKVGKKEIDFRVSSCPTVSGENIVLRILDKSSVKADLEKIGMTSEQFKSFKEMIYKPYGIILVTGPTGSGKTTTLYSALQELNKEDVNIMTVEDPVEYQFPQIRQVHMNSKIGLTFASALRSFLRQDPDIIMVGEIRDHETAEIAVQAALTGHLVFSTLHTNDAPTSFIRLIEMGIEPFLVTSSLLGVLAQRLVRRICESCKEEYNPPHDILTRVGITNPASMVFYKGRGCQICGKTGYKGRLGIFELLKNSQTIQKIVLSDASADTIKQQAQKEGLMTLRDSALEKLKTGVTTLEEVLRVTQEF